MQSELDAEIETPKPQEDAVQVETTGQVPVQPEAPVSEEVEQGKPEAEPKVVTEEGVKAEEVTPELRDVESTAKALEDINNKEQEELAKVRPILVPKLPEFPTPKDVEIVEEKQKLADEINAKREAIKQEFADKRKAVESLIPQEQTPAQKVEQLRAKEQAELKAAIPNADQYLTDGKVDKDKLTNDKDREAFSEIYDKYDKLITPLLPKKEQPAPKQEAPAKAEPKLKPRVETRIKFAKAIELFNDISATKGGAKKRTLSAKRKLFLEQNPSIKYIDDNWRKISKQLEDKGLLKKEGNCP
jgi:hypothetical protein